MVKIGLEYEENIWKIKYKGEYLNCEKNGKGQEYDYDYDLKYEGEYLNHEEKGKGKE